MIQLVLKHYSFMVINLVALCYADDYMKLELSLVKPYLGEDMTISNWDISGSTSVTSSYVRLTPDLQLKSGALWNAAPVMSQNWEIIVNFKVSGDNEEYSGDGFAIWYARDRLELGPVFGSKDHFSGLAIIFNTSSNYDGPQNHQHSYISAVINNGSWSYNHTSDGTHTQLSGCDAKLRNLDYETHISIKYSMEVLTVYTDLENNTQWKLCFESANVKLPTGYYLGASASTGNPSNIHDIISIKFYELQPLASPEVIQQRLSIIPEVKTSERPFEEEEYAIEPSSLKIYTLVLMCMLIAILLAFVCGDAPCTCKRRRNRRVARDSSRAITPGVCTIS